MLDFNTLNTFLEKLYVESEVLNRAFRFDSVAKNDQAVINEPDSQYIATIKVKAAKQLYQFLSELKILHENEAIFTSYALGHWIEMYFCFPWNDDIEIQVILNEIYLPAFNAQHYASKKIERWDHYAIKTYVGLATLGFISTLITISQIPGLSYWINMQEKIFSLDIATDIVLNTVECIASFIFSYVQWKWGEYEIAKVNFIGAFQTLIATLVGMGIGLNGIFNDGFQSQKSQEAIEAGGKILSVACALGMFFTATAEYLKYNANKERKNKLVFIYFQQTQRDTSNAQDKILQNVSNPIYFINLYKQITKETTFNVLLGDMPIEKYENISNKEKILVMGMAIMQAQANNSLHNMAILMVYSAMMSLLTGCDFFPVITKKLTPIAIQSLVFITAIFGYYISVKYDNIMALKIYLDRLTRKDSSEVTENIPYHSTVNSTVTLQYYGNRFQKYLFSWHSETKAENSYQKLIDQTDNSTTASDNELLTSKILIKPY